MPLGQCPVGVLFETANGYFSLRYAISRHAYAIASRIVSSAALHSAIDVGGIRGSDRDNRDLGSCAGQR
jgi:hypothetical protein